MPPRTIPGQRYGLEMDRRWRQDSQAYDLLPKPRPCPLALRSSSSTAPPEGGGCDAALYLSCSYGAALTQPMKVRGADGRGR